MKSEDKIDTLIEELDFKAIESRTVREVFPDTIVRIVDHVGIRYQSPTLNSCADKHEFTWEMNKMFLCPYTELNFEYNGLIRVVKVHTEPYRVFIASKFLDKIIPEDYTKDLESNSFSKSIIRWVDIEIADGIISKNWKIDRNLLTAKTKTFLTLS